MTEAEQAEIDEVDKHVDALRQKWDSVTIFVSREAGAEDMSIGREAGNTISISRGIGNWFSRFGMIRMWLVDQEEGQKIERRREDDGRDET